ncbi:MAG: toll/interleukin-1 receptor domain-containing protein [Lachnospiraceae bacterium]|nr:toll/interleukin-1 receptor domain-containing protein [Lachnospiraceae bacterium]
MVAQKQEMRSIVVVIPKFELKCKRDGGSTVTFVLKNVSSVIVSNISVETFELIAVDNSSQNLFNMNIEFPTSLGPNEVEEITLSHRVFEVRGVGYKEFRFVFTLEDEQSNQYRYVATKNVEDRRNYMSGGWIITSTLLKRGNMEDKSMDKPTVFISYNWGSDETADETEKRLSPIAIVQRDKSSIAPWGSISAFMKKIRKADLVVLIVSDSYLKSVNCLYEVMQLLKDDNWINHSMFLVEDSAKEIYKPIGQLNYVKYWINEKENLEKALVGMDPALVTSQAEELKKIKLIQLNINEFMKNVADSNNPDLAKAIEAVERRVQNNICASETEDDIRLSALNQPIFDVKIVELNKQIPGTVDPINIWGRRELLPKHKNVCLQIELYSEVTIRNLKVFGRSLEKGIVKRNHPYQLNVCYMESPDKKWKELILELSRDPYPADEDGIPKIVPLEYTIDAKNYQQIFRLGDDMTYFSGEQEEIIPKDINKVILMKNQMRKDFLKAASELGKYSREELWKNPEKKFISDEVIIISTDCRDSKWNTDDGFGKYEIYDFCDEGLLCWDNTGSRAQVKYYYNDRLLVASANRMLCLPFEKIVSYDLEGNSRYNMPIIYSEYPIGESPFKIYYRDSSSGDIIDNGIVVYAKVEA